MNFSAVQTVCHLDPTSRNKFRQRKVIHLENTETALLQMCWFFLRAGCPRGLGTIPRATVEILVFLLLTHLLSIWEIWIQLCCLPNSEEGQELRYIAFLSQVIWSIWRWLSLNLSYLSVPLFAKIMNYSLDRKNRESENSEPKHQLFIQL